MRVLPLPFDPHPFAAGGKEVRSVRLMNAFADAFEHTVISAEPESMGARGRGRGRLDRSACEGDLPAGFPLAQGLAPHRDGWWNWPMR